MAVRNSQYDGTDWSDPEVLYSDDLNDTFDTTNTSFNDMKAYALAPIGSIVGYHVDWASSNGSIPSGWLSCDGSVVDDSDSPLDGQTLPDLNGTTDSDSRFIRGNSTSGSTGGDVSHEHNPTSTYDQDPDENAYSAQYYTEEDHIPTYFEVRWIIRVK